MRHSLTGLLLLLAGCAATPGYEGPRRAGSEVAVVTASLPVTAGAAVTLRLRKVDAEVLAFGVWRVELVPGRHALLVDCTTRDPERTTRHEVLLEAEAGGRYRLAAVIGSPQEGCSGVAIE